MILLARMPLASISGSADGAVYVKKPDGSIRNWNLSEYVDRFQVYEADTLELAVGDRVRVTKNGFAEYSSKQIQNSTVHTFRGIDEHGDLRFDHDLVLARNFAHLAHGYCSTSFTAQGKTVDYVLVAESAESLADASRQQFYVSLSRGKIRPEVFTHCKQDLLEAVQETSLRPSAMDLIHQSTRAPTIMAKPGEPSPKHEQVIVGQQAVRRTKVQSGRIELGASKVVPKQMATRINAPTVKQEPPIWQLSVPADPESPSLPEPAQWTLETALQQKSTSQDQRKIAEPEHEIEGPEMSI